MFSILLAFTLFVGQEPHFTYSSENAIFLKSPAFVLSIQASSETPKTVHKSPEITRPVPPIKDPRQKPFRIDPQNIAPLTIPIDAGGGGQEKPIPPVSTGEKAPKKVYETVFFDIDSYELKPSEKVKLDTLSKDENYMVTGFTCDIGGKNYNDRLALKRAMAVKEYLGDIIKEVNAKGKCCYLDPKNRDKNRRAEIKPLTK